MFSWPTPADWMRTPGAPLGAKRRWRWTFPTRDLWWLNRLGDRLARDRGEPGKLRRALLVGSWIPDGCIWILDYGVRFWHREWYEVVGQHGRFVEVGLYLDSVVLTWILILSQIHALMGTLVELRYLILELWSLMPLKPMYDFWSTLSWPGKSVLFVWAWSQSCLCLEPMIHHMSMCTGSPLYITLNPRFIMPTTTPRAHNCTWIHSKNLPCLVQVLKKLFGTFGIPVQSRGPRPTNTWSVYPSLCHGEC